MRLRTATVLALCAVISGCAMIRVEANPHKAVLLSVAKWQEELCCQGWSEALVDSVVEEVRRVSVYGGSAEDFRSPVRIVAADFEGVCHDWAVAMMWVLVDLLRYPYGTAIFNVDSLSGGHSLFRVTLPDGRTKIYETTRGPIAGLDRIFDVPTCEILESGRIVWFGKQSKGGYGHASNVQKDMLDLP